MIKLITILFILLVVKIAEAQNRKEIISEITTTASSMGLDPDLAVAIATVESGLNPKAVGGLNEQGLFQLRPEFHKLTGDIKNNVRTGVSYLVSLKMKSFKKFGNAWFVLFNYGPNKGLKNPKQTVYYKKVMHEMGKIKSKRYVLANIY